MPQKILMIDDDPVLVRIVGDVLSAANRQVFSAVSGRDGIRKAVELLPDLILLDVNLPDMLGFEVCEAIRGTSKIKGIPIIMLTGHFIQSSDKVSALDKGADDYLVKPFDNDVLAARVEALLRRSPKPRQP